MFALVFILFLLKLFVACLVFFLYLRDNTCYFRIGKYISDAVHATKLLVSPLNSLSDHQVVASIVFRLFGKGGTNQPPNMSFSRQTGHLKKRLLDNRPLSGAKTLSLIVY